jgi:hypothetical protein
MIQPIDTRHWHGPPRRRGDRDRGIVAEAIAGHVHEPTSQCPHRIRIAAVMISGLNERRHATDEIE